jgi:hypothetical protein
VIRNWIGLAVIAVVVVYGGRWVVSEHIDLTFIQFATVVCATLLQAAALAWYQRQPGGAVRRVAQSVWRQPLAQPVIVLEAIVLGAGLVWWDTYVAGFGAPVSVQYQWTWIKAVLAIALFLMWTARLEGRFRTAAVAAFTGPVLLVFALEPSTSWLAATFARMRGVLGEQGEVLQRIVVYGVVFLLLLTWTLRAARVLEARRSEIGYLLHLTVAASLGAAVAVVLATFNLPQVTQPFLGFATLFASVAASSVLLSAVVLNGTHQGGADEVGVPGRRAGAGDTHGGSAPSDTLRQV